MVATSFNIIYFPDTKMFIFKGGQSIFVEVIVCEFLSLVLGLTIMIIMPFCGPNRWHDIGRWLIEQGVAKSVKMFYQKNGSVTVSIRNVRRAGRL